MTSLDLFTTLESQCEDYVNDVIVYEQCAQTMDKILLGGKSLDEEGQKSISTCGHLFSKGEMIFHCKDCAVDDTCVLCASCFKKEDHVGHNFKYYLSRGSGGSCDCGETESWKKNLSCPHSSREFPTSPQEIYISEHWGENLAYFLKLIEVLGGQIPNRNHRPEYSPNQKLILLNDELHSFMEVIDVLCRAFNISRLKAQQYALCVDKVGFCQIKEFENDPEAAKISLEIVNESGLGYLLDSEYYNKMCVSTCFMQWLVDLRRRSPYLFESILQTLLNDPEQFLFKTLTFEYTLWKSIRKNLVTFCTAALYNQEFKSKMGFHLASNTLKPLEVVVQRKEVELHLSMCHFGVQVFTVPSVAMLLCQNKIYEHYLGRKTDEMYSLISKITDSSIDYSKSVEHVFYDINHVLKDAEVIKSRILMNDEKFWELFIYSIVSASNRFPISQLTEEHIVYESNAWIYEGTVGINWILLCGTVSLLCKTVEDCEYVIQKLNQNVPSNLAHNLISFQQPYLWFYGAVLLRLVSLSPCSEITPPIFVNVALQAFRQIDFLCQVKAGLWVRNGHAVSLQCTIAERRFSLNLLYETIIAFYLKNIQTKDDELMKSIKNSFDNAHSKAQADPARIPYFVRLISFVSAILMGINLGNPEGYSATEIFVINFLASGPKSYAEIKKNIPDLDGIFKNENIEDLLIKFATSVVRKDIFASQQYQLKSEFFKLVNPFYVGLVDEESSLAIENVNQKSFSNIFALANGQYSSFNFNFRLFVELFGEYLLREVVEMACTLNIKTQILVEIVWLSKFFKTLYPPLQVNMVDSSWVVSVVNEGYNEPTVRRSIFTVLCEVFPAIRDGLKSDTTDSEKSNTKLNETLKNRKRSILENMKSRQSQFANSNVDAVMEIDHVSDETLERKMFTGTCVVCQELCDESSESYGFFSRKEKVSVWRMSVRRDSNGNTAPTPKDCNLCFHLIHEKCFFSLRRTLYNYKKCPLCGFLSNKLILVPSENVQMPTLNDAAPYPACTHKYRKYTQCLRGCAQQYTSLINLDSAKELQEVIKKATLFIQKAAAVFDPYYEDFQCPLEYRLYSTLFAMKFSNETSNQRLTEINHFIRNFFDRPNETMETEGADADLLKNHDLSAIEIESHLCCAIIRLWYDAHNVPLPTELSIEISKVITDPFHELPHDYIDIFPTMNETDLQPVVKRPNLCNIDCSMCDLGRVTLLCLRCGVPQCNSTTCRKSFVNHKCYSRSSNLVVFLDVEICALRVLWMSFVGIIPAPYVDAHGENDLGFRNGGPLHLSSKQFTEIKKMFIMGTLWTFVLHHTDGNPNRFFSLGLNITTNVDDFEEDIYTVIV